MGTRRFIAVRYRGLYYIMYNHFDSYIMCNYFDSYLKGLGSRLVELLAKYPDVQLWKYLLDRATFIHLSSDNIPAPSPEFLEQVRLFIESDERLTMYWEQQWRFKNMLGRPITALDFLHDANKFRDFCLSLGVKAWEYLSWSYYPKLLFRILELGIFVHSETPSHLPPLTDLFIEYVYVINVDCGAFSVNNGSNVKNFRMNMIPKHWMACIDMPINWIKLAHGYSPSAIRKVMSLKLGIDLYHIWTMVLDKFSNEPYANWEHYLAQAYQYLFAHNLILGDHENIESLDRDCTEELDDRLRTALLRKGVGPFQMLMEVFHIPTTLPRYLADLSVKLDRVDPALRSLLKSIEVREDDQLLCLPRKTSLLTEPILIIIFHEFVSKYDEYFRELPGLSCDMGLFIWFAQSLLGLIKWTNVKLSIKATATEIIQKETLEDTEEEAPDKIIGGLAYQNSSLPWIFSKSHVPVLLAIHLETTEGQTQAIAMAVQHFQEMACDDAQKEHGISVCAFSVSHIMAIHVLQREAGITVTHTRAVPVVMLRNEHTALACNEGFQLLLDCFTVGHGHEIELGCSRSNLGWVFQNCIQHGDKEAVYEAVPKNAGLSEILKVCTVDHCPIGEEAATGFYLGERKLEFVECLACEGTFARSLVPPMQLWICRFA